MNPKLIDMVIKEMDHVDLLDQFNDLRAKGAGVDCMLKFLRYALPSYESEKRKLLSQEIDQTFIAISDQIMEDPSDVYNFSDMSKLKKLAKHLNIKINASNK